MQSFMYSYYYVHGGNSEGFGDPTHIIESELLFVITSSGVSEGFD